jgi:hypothetical protein
MPLLKCLRKRGSFNRDSLDALLSITNSFKRDKKRYHELFFLIDTCQASTMYSKIRSPNVLAAASSLKGESSYSHHASYELGVAVIDRFTYYNLETLEHLKTDSQSSLQDLVCLVFVLERKIHYPKKFNTYDPNLMHSTPGIRTDLFPRPMTETLVTDFFGGVAHAEITRERYPLAQKPLLRIPPARPKKPRAAPLTKKQHIFLRKKRAESFRVEFGERPWDVNFSLGGFVFVGVFGYILFTEKALETASSGKA